MNTVNHLHEALFYLSIWCFHKSKNTIVTFYCIFDFFSFTIDNFIRSFFKCKKMCYRRHSFWAVVFCWKIIYNVAWKKRRWPKTTYFPLFTKIKRGYWVTILLLHTHAGKGGCLTTCGNILDLKRTCDPTYSFQSRSSIFFKSFTRNK